MPQVEEPRDDLARLMQRKQRSNERFGHLVEDEDKDGADGGEHRAAPVVVGSRAGGRHGLAKQAAASGDVPVEGVLGLGLAADAGLR